MRASWIAAFAVASAFADPRLPALISDHMVLQQGVAVNIWGKADPGEKIEVRFGAASPRTTSAGPAGDWKVTMDPLRPGGPFELTVRGTRTITVHDVLVGEVWVLSGQSNMAFELNRASNARTAIPDADDPGIRLFTVPKKSTTAPLDDVRGSWAACSPETARSFSAVGYFFGEELHRKLGVPIGLIHSSWPGTRAEQWTPRDLLDASAELRPIVERAQPSPEPPPFDLEFDDFELLRAPDGHDAVPLMNFDEGSCPLCTYNWGSGESSSFSLVAPGYRGAGFAARIEGHIDPSRAQVLKFRYREDNKPVDLSMYSGIRFRYRGAGQFRLFSIQPTITDADDYGSPVLRAGKDWQTAVIPFASLKQAGWGRQLSFTPFALKAFQLQTDMGDVQMPPSGLFDGMIAPLARFTIRGAAWYQGEGNAGRAWQYRTLLPGMIRGWRRAWGQGDFPFLIVQLPNYGRASLDPSESAWAELREAQLYTSQTVPRTGLAVAIDLGEADNVHPALKQPVGHRLALQALASVYGQKLVASGPMFASMQIDGRVARIRFTSTGTGLAVRDGGRLKGFAIAGADRKFVWADATIDGDSVVVQSLEVSNPAAVRYAWANDPDCNLINNEGLPASPFRTDDWPASTMHR